MKTSATPIQENILNNYINDFLERRNANILTVDIYDAGDSFNRLKKRFILDGDFYHVYIDLATNELSGNLPKY